MKTKVLLAALLLLALTVGVAYAASTPQPGTSGWCNDPPYVPGGWDCLPSPGGVTTLWWLPGNVACHGIYLYLGQTAEGASLWERAYPLPPLVMVLNPDGSWSAHDPKGIAIGAGGWGNKPPPKKK